MKGRSLLMGLLLLLTCILLPSHDVHAQKQPLPTGLSDFSMAETAGATTDSLKVYTYKPAAWQDGRPIVVVFHGLKRNAEEYCQGWKEYAEKHNFLIACPEFTESKFPGVRYYNFGNVIDNDNTGGNIQPTKQWIFPVIDNIIKETKKQANAKKSRVIIYGHSAGAQLVHRYVLLNKGTSADLIIAANSGWYTMPDENITYSYGIKGLNLTKKEFRNAFTKPVVILLGENDTLRSKVLRKTPEADAQGQNRLERGRNFYNNAQNKATSLGLKFNWQLITVPGVGHDGTGMAKGAIPLIEALAR